MPFGYLQRDRSPVAAQPQYVAFRSQRNQRLPLYRPVRKVQRFVHIKSVHLHTNFPPFSPRPNGKFHACRCPHTAPILINFSFRLVNDPSLIGSGVASVRRKSSHRAAARHRVNAGMETRQILKPRRAACDDGAVERTAVADNSATIAWGNLD